MPIGINVGEILEGAGKALDGLFTSGEERLKARAILLEAQNKLSIHALDHEKDVILAQRDIIVSEAKSQSWLARNIRPLSLLTFLVVFANNYIIYPYLRLFWTEAPVLTLPELFWTAFMLMIGGYVGSRGAEKIVGKIKETGSEDISTAKEMRAKRKLLKAQAKAAAAGVLANGTT
jgi:hypothetical protein